MKTIRSALISNKTLSRQMQRFLFSGLSAVATDSLVYYLLVLLHLTYSPAKTISFLAGTIVAYILNKFYTFEKKERSFSETVLFLTLYLLTMGVNVGVNATILHILGASMATLAFLIATACSTVLNFLGQKFVVFQK